MKDNALVKMAVDLYKGSTDNFSKEEVNEKLRQKFIELNGGSEKITYKTFRKNGPEMFDIIEETLDYLVGTILEDQFGSFAEVRNVALGDKPLFAIRQRKLFPVAKVAAGNGDLRRYRLDKGNLTVDTDWYATAIYEEFERFLAGRIDWNELIQTVALSMAHKMGTDIYNAIYNSYSKLGANYAVTGVFDEGKLVKLATYVQTLTGSKPKIYGTRMALAKVLPAHISYNMMDKKNEIGFFAQIAGLEVQVIDQAFDNLGSDTFQIADDFLLVIPSGNEKIVKVVIEGNSIVKETNMLERNDDQLEYQFRKKAGVSVLMARGYGIYKLA